MDQRLLVRRPPAPSIHPPGTVKAQTNHPAAPAYRPPMPAPPVYRPVSGGVQAKPAPGLLPANRPVYSLEHRPAPPVYRPVSSGVQAKSAPGVPLAIPPAGALEKRSAPPIYRPQRVGMQMGAAPPAAPPAYRSSQYSLQPTVAAFAPRQPRLAPPAVHRPQFRAMQPRISSPSGKRPSVLQLKEMEELIQYLSGQDYARERNYMTWKQGPRLLPHVGWKAHIAGTADTSLKIIETVCPFLINNGMGHKVDINDEVFTTSRKFITIYAANDDVFQEIIPTLEKLLSSVGSTRDIAIEGDMSVGAQGLVWMRHGQNTPLTRKILVDKGIGLNECKSRKTCTQWTGIDVTYSEEWRYLWSAAGDDGPFFFTREDNLPPDLNPKTVAMAILYNGKILPDLRDDPNPANAQLPSGVQQWHAPESSSSSNSATLTSTPRQRRPRTYAISPKTVATAATPISTSQTGSPLFRWKPSVPRRPPASNTPFLNSRRQGSSHDENS